MNGKGYYHKYSASMMISVVMILNTITLVAVIHILTGILILPADVPKIFGVLIALAYGVFNYYYFTVNERYINILNRHKNESWADEKQGNIIVTVFVIGSLILMIVSGFLGIYINQIRQGV